MFIYKILKSIMIYYFVEKYITYKNKINCISLKKFQIDKNKYQINYKLVNSRKTILIILYKYKTV